MGSGLLDIIIVKMNSKEVDEVIDFIYQMGLENDFMQYTPYHFKILKKINVWPNTKRYYIDGDKTGSKTYNSIYELINIIEKYEKTVNKRMSL